VRRGRPRLSAEQIRQRRDELRQVLLQAVLDDLNDGLEAPTRSELARALDRSDVGLKMKLRRAGVRYRDLVAEARNLLDFCIPNPIGSRLWLTDAERVSVQLPPWWVDPNAPTAPPPAEVRKAAEKRAHDHAAAFAAACRAYVLHIASPDLLAHSWGPYRLDIVEAHAGGRRLRETERAGFLANAAPIFTRLAPVLAHAALVPSDAEWLTCRDWAAAHVLETALSPVLARLGGPIHAEFTQLLRTWGFQYAEHHQVLEDASWPTGGMQWVMTSVSSPIDREPMLQRRQAYVAGPLEAVWKPLNAAACGVTPIDYALVTKGWRKEAAA